MHQSTQISLPTPPVSHSHQPPIPTDSFDSDFAYRRRLLFSVVLSFLFNLVFFWLILTFNISRFTWLGTKPKPGIHKEPPQLVLVKSPEFVKPRAKIFLETVPSQAVKEKPVDARFYSEHNTLATQTAPSPVKPGDIPIADGSNTRTMNTETVRPGSKPAPSLPAEPQPFRPAETQTSPSAVKPSPKTPTEPSKSGDYALLKTSPPLEKTVPQTEPRPESVKPTPQTAARSTPVPSVPSSNLEITATKSKLAGGVRRTGKVMAFNSAESPVAGYDKKVIGKIDAYWQRLIEGRFYGEKVGEVEISFKLLADGRVTELHVIHNTANEVLAGWCIQAMEQSSPFEPFPDSIRAVFGDVREGSIRFFY